jgi:hypothetical protein
MKVLTRGNSSYREELDEIIQYGDQTTSTDNTEAETSDADKPDKKKNQRKSRLPWSTPSLDGNSGEQKASNFFSFTSAPIDEVGNPGKRLKKKRRPKDGDGHVNAIGIAVSVRQPSSVKSPDSEISHLERGVGTLTPEPWTRPSNISQSSLKSDLSHRSHVSSNRSSIELHRPDRPGTPTDRPTVSGPPTTFAAIQERNFKSSADDLPAHAVPPSLRPAKARRSSHSSNHSGDSTGKSSKIGAWLRKKRGVSVSSSTSAGGGSSAVSD